MRSKLALVLVCHLLVGSLVVTEAELVVDDATFFAAALPHLFPEQMALVPPPEGRCIISELRFCQKEFAEALGTKPDIFKTPQLFLASLHEIYKKKVNEGFLGLCKARNKLASCLADSYPACTDVFNIMRDQGLERPDAFLLADLYNNIDFDCSSGFVQVTENWDCQVTVHNSDAWKTKSKDCVDTFNQTIHRDWNKFCSASQRLSLCLAGIYRDDSIKQCKTKEIMWWECERALRRSQLDGFCGESTCAALFEDDPERVEFKSLAEESMVNQLMPPAWRKFVYMTGKHASQSRPLRTAQFQQPQH